jgi:hypothetical protein
MQFQTRPRLRQDFSMIMIKTGIAMFLVFGGFYFYFNFGRSTDSLAAGATMTVVQNGNWNSASTWSLNRLPQDSDTLIVPAGMTLNVNIVTQSYVHMYMQVYGTIHFVSGKKIVMCDGIVQVYSGGLLEGESVGSKIDICNNMVWDGNDPGTGPLYFSNNPLPIELVTFTARTADKKVTLNWTTANEINNDYFTIERADNGNNFLPIKTMKGAGNSTTLMQYTTFDENPLNGTNFYRLKQTDYDGNFTYSKVVTLRVDNPNSNKPLFIGSVNPNPFTQNFTIHYFTPTDGSANLMVMNSTGSIITQETVQATAGPNTYAFTENDVLARGIYYVKLSMNDKSVAQKIIKN